MELSEIVTVAITRESVNVSQAGFGTLLIVGPNVNVDNRLEYFTSAAAAKAKILGTTSRELELVDALFAQNPAPTRVALGALQSSKTAVFTGTITAGTVKGYVNGTEYSQDWSTDLDGTITALAVKMAADAAVDTAEYTAGTNTLVFTPNTGKVMGISFLLTGITGTAAYTLTATELSETYDTALDAIVLEQTDFYAVAIESVTNSKQITAATWAQANKRIAGFVSADANIIGQTLAQDTTSIAALLDDQALDKSFVIYSAAAATEGAEAAVFGKILPLDPGQYTVKFKTLASVTVDTLTATQSTNARAKHCNTYETVGGVNIVSEGTVGTGEFLDVMIFIDWLYARIQESVFAQLAKVRKVAYTDAGIALVQSALTTPLKEGQDNGGISPTAFDDDNVQIGGYVVTVPSLADVSAADKASRTLDNVKFTAWLAGAIHKVQIDGIVTL